jgi:hypothetical protein
VSPEVFLVACAVCLAVCACALVFAYQWGVYRGSVKAGQKPSPSVPEAIALKEGQTIVGVVDTTKAMCFFIGKNVRNDSNYE